MFEYDNDTFTLEELQGVAKEQGVDFDAFIKTMKDAGMTDVYEINMNPKNNEEAIESVKNIRINITENTPEVINVIADEYFNLSNMKRSIDTQLEDGSIKVVDGKGMFSGRTDTKVLQGWGGLIKSNENTLDQDLKNHFEKINNESFVDINTGKTKVIPRKTGDFSKYEQYKEYKALLDEGKTPSEAFNLDWVDQSTKSNAVNFYKKQKTEQYTQNALVSSLGIPNKEMIKAVREAAQEENLQIFGEDLATAYKYTQALKKDRILMKEYHDNVQVKIPSNLKTALKILPSVYGTAFSLADDLGWGMHNRNVKKPVSTAQKILNDYVTKKQEKLSREFYTFELDTKKHFNVKVEYEKEITKLQQEFKALGVLNRNSSPEEILNYEKLVSKYTSITEKASQEVNKLNIIERSKSLLVKSEEMQMALDKITDSNEIVKSFSKNYNSWSNASLALEEAIIGDMGSMGWGTLKYISDIAEKVYAGRAKGTMAEAYGQETDKNKLARVLKNLKEDDNLAIADYFQNQYAAHLDYKESLQNHRQAFTPLNIPWRDVKFFGPDANLGEVSSQLLGNNSFSILSALTYGGAVARVSKLGAAAGYTVPQATRLLTGTFFTVEGGAKLSQMEIAQKNAAENIAYLEQALPLAVTQDERLQILEQISDQDKALNVTQVQKAFSTILYGGIAAYAERLGTMGYVKRLNIMLKGVSKPTLKNFGKGVATFGFNSGVEYIEEFVTQVGHNLTDVTILDQNKSLVAGIDAEFNMNVLFSTMAIQSPSTGKNIYNAVRNEISSKKDITEDRKNRDELISILHTLKQDDEFGGLKPGMRKFLEDKRNDLLRAAGVKDSYTFANAAQMTRGEIDALFEKQAKKRDILAQSRDLGVSAAEEVEESDATRRQRKILAGDLNQTDNEIQELLLKPEERNRKTVEEVLGKENVQAGDEFYFGKFQGAKQIANALGKQASFKDDIVDGERVEGSGRIKLVKFLNEQLKKRNITSQYKDEVLAGFEKGNYAFHVGNTAVLMEDNIINGINSAPSSLAKSIIAYSPFHELQHINDITTGLVKDGDVIETQKVAVEGIQDHLDNLYERGAIKENDYNLIKRRIDQYTKNNGGNVNLKELLTIAGELKDAGVLSQESRSPLLSLKILLNKFIRRNFGDNEMFFKLKNTEQVLQYIDSFQRGAKGARLMLGPEEETESVNFSEVYQEVEAMYNEEAWADPKKRSDLALTMAYTLIPETIRRMQNVSLDDYIKEDIAIDFATSDKRGLFGLIKKYDSEINDSVMGYLNSFVKTPKGKFKLFDLRLQEFYQEDPRYSQIIQSMEQEGVGVKVDKMIDEKTSLDNALEDIKKTKINVLKIGKVANKEQDIIKVVKVKKDDTSKEVIKNNKGDVGSIIFNIPANKIANPQDNITTSDKIINPKTNKSVKKGETGIPERSEATNIQDFFADINTAKSFIQILTDTNVTEKDADVNKVGENIKVARDVYGRAIGLPNRILEYFYDKKFRPNGTRLRSQGLTSQVGIWELKDEFKNLSDKELTKAAEQFQKDLGITEKQEVNKLPTKANRSKIGQLLKGAAVVISQQASLSAAQRKLEKAKAPKKQIAGITAAQSKAAFSEVIGNVDAMYALEGGAIKLTFEGDLNRINKILEKFIGEGVYKFNDEAQIRDYFKDFEGIVIKNLPRNMFMGALNSFLKPSKRILPNSGEGKITLEDGRTVSINDFFDEMRAELVERSKKEYKGKDKVVFGAEFKGEGAKYVYGRTYGSIYGKTNKEIEKSFYDGTREKQNAIFASMHEQFMARVNASIRKNNKNAKVWGNYFSIVSQNTEHPWRMGAEYVLFSKNPIGYKEKGKKFKLYEWEHAMMATRSYLYLIETSLEQINGEYLDFNRAYKLVMENYKLIALDNYDDKVKLRGAGRQESMGKGWQFLVNTWLDRYFHPDVAAIKGGIKPSSLQGEGRQTADKIYNVNVEGGSSILKTGTNKIKKLNTAIQKAKTPAFSEAIQGITVLDFDDTLATTKSLVKYTTQDGKIGALNAEEFANTYQDLLEQGYKFDFTEFNKVVKGKLAPLFQKALKLQGKFGPENMFVLTARPPQAAKAIHDFLKANGLNIPIKNITGLANSTAEAKALWVAEKVGEGYNDFYFADDALQNVQAVKNMLNQFDVKSKVQQAKVSFSESMNEDFNDILEKTTGIDSKKRFSAIKARKRGNSKGRFRFFIPPSHEDLVGLLYNFIGKGKIGDAHRDFFEQALVRPLNRAYRELNTAKQSIANDYKSLNKKFKDIKKKLTKKTPDGDFTYQDAIRIYLWDKHGHKIPGLSETDQQNLVDLIKNDFELKTYAEALNVISKQEAYVKPTENWETGDIRVDLDDATGRVGREQFFAEFFENADVIFSDENFNKIEAAFGAGVVSAFKDILYRTRTGRNRPSGQNEQVNKWMNYLNGSVAATMFFNIRSAVLQQMSMVNFINFADNNMFAAAKAFVNRKQYWSDWATIFNSDFMKQRRGGIKTDINGADLAASLRGAKNTPRALLAKLLELGFLPTQIGDNIAIATGGATFYRNRINTYLKQGLNKKEAEAKAWIDFQVLAEATQQSARPDMVSQQQASALGKIILAFQNVTSQFNRIGKKAFLDIKNKRITPGNTTLFQSNVSNLSRIAYYFAIQNLIFYSLQTALFAAMFDDDEDDERLLKKKERILNGTIDSILRGAGVWGAVVATIKNMAIASHREREKDWNGDESSVLVEALNLSPPLGIKARKLVNAEKTLNYNKKVIKIMETFDIDNPMWSAYTSRIEAITNIPLNRLYNKTQNIRQALNNQNSAYQRALMFMGWSQYNLGIENQKMDDIKNKSKKKKRKILI